MKKGKAGTTETEYLRDKINNCVFLVTCNLFKLFEPRTFYSLGRCSLRPVLRK